MEGESPPVHTRAAFLGLLARRVAVAGGAFAVGFAVDAVWARLLRGIRLEREQYPTAVVRGWRIHHNVVGWLLLVAGAFWHPFLLIPAGLGMIVGHRTRDRLWWFLERVG